MGLLHRILKEERSVTNLIDRGVTIDMFIGEELTVYHYIENHQRKYGQIPEIDTVKRKLNIEFGKYSDEPLGYWIDEIVKRWQNKIMVATEKEILGHINAGDTEKAVATARDLSLKLSENYCRDRVVKSDKAINLVLDDHRKKKWNYELSGIPFGFPYLDEISDGAQPSDTIAIVGRPSAGKTYFLLNMVLHAYLSNHVPLVLSMEMSVLQCMRRILALHSKVNATLIRIGHVGYYGESKLIESAEQFRSGIGTKIHFLEGSLKSNVEDLALRIQEVRPDVLYVDGAYLLRTRTKTPSRWERVAETAEILKTIAKDFNIPVIATYQFNRRGIGLDNIALSDAIGQLASIVCGIEDDPEDKKNERLSADQQKKKTKFHKLLHILKGREGETGCLKILFDMGIMSITQKEILDDRETYQDEDFCGNEIN